MDSTIISAIITGVFGLLGVAITFRGINKPSPDEPPKGPTTDTPNPSTQKIAKKVLPGTRCTVYGKVIPTRGRDIGIRVQNESELRQFWKDNEIDRKLDWFGRGAPVCSIGRTQDIKSCKIGDEVSLTFVTFDDRRGRRGIRTVEFEVISQA